MEVFQLEKQAEVSIAGAQALGQMGANSIGSVDMGCDAGFSSAAMIVGMAIGGIVRRNIADMMSGMNRTMPPFVPMITYYVIINGEAAGLFEIPVLKQMAASGQLINNSLVWMTGLAA